MRAPFLLRPRRTRRPAKRPRVATHPASAFVKEIEAAKEAEDAAGEAESEAAMNTDDPAGNLTPTPPEGVCLPLLSPRGGNFSHLLHPIWGQRGHHPPPPPQDDWVIPKKGEAPRRDKQDQKVRWLERERRRQRVLVALKGAASRGSQGVSTLLTSLWEGGVPHR